ncbi:hypothetical protein [Pinibacter aurantiacus]|uniref:Uncharacterized protein n=1 Tax=Pinibacter aurantiacus TaxID=2851599 RepID=A0A9E2SGS2_9BACT|nr:hypothetical protein [Pinibacter aurantiacus]MBV4360490.1 hypothetical protein [Pinibacter aurantiacus]
MEDYVMPLVVILIGGLFAPLLTQLIEKTYESVSHSEPLKKPEVYESKEIKRKKWLKFFAFAVLMQLILFTGFFFLSKLVYYDKNYFSTSERELIRTGLKKGKDYVIPKMTIRIFSERPKTAGLYKDSCSGNAINYCMLVSISYEVIALRAYNSEKIFSEEYNALYAKNVVREPGSEEEGPDGDPNAIHLIYDLKTSMAKYERKTITTRADYLYDTLAASREFFKRVFTGRNFDMFYYYNKEDDVIGEIEFQIISRSLKFDNPNTDDALYEKASGQITAIKPDLILSNEAVGCMQFNILTCKIPRLNYNDKFGIRWKWTN